MWGLELIYTRNSFILWDTRGRNERTEVDKKLRMSEEDQSSTVVVAMTNTTVAQYGVLWLDLILVYDTMCSVVVKYLDLLLLHLGAVRDSESMFHCFGGFCIGWGW